MYIRKHSLLAPTIFCALLAGLDHSRAAETNQPPTSRAAPNVTNGLSAAIQVIRDAQRRHLPEIEITVATTNAYGFYERPYKSWKEVNVVLELAFADGLLYFAPTNRFCGPITLRDRTGHEVPTLRPEVVRPGSYPIAVSIRNPTQPGGHEAPVLGTPLIFSPDELARFSLGDYFAVTEPGEYKLTVWPKIYKRVSTNDNICRRIDLPPVSAIIEVNSPTAN